MRAPCLGEGLGIEKSSGAPLLEPVLQYQIILPEGCDPRAMLPKLRQIEGSGSWERYSFGVDVAFDDGSIVYTILLLEPGERGSGLKFDVNCSEDVLAKSWQRLVLTHLEEKVHKGVLTGWAHNKHTQGGDFREATYRAVRQGLKEAESILLEHVRYPR